MLRAWRRLFGPPRPRPAALEDSLLLMGERVLLRPLSVRDAEAMFAYASDPEVTRFLPWQPAVDSAAVRSFLREQVARRKRGESLGLAVVLRETGAMIGSTDLMGFLSEPGRAELGYLLAREHWGSGLMTEATRLTLQHGFAALRLNRVVAFADAENLASRRVLEKLGMETTGSEVRLVKGVDRLYIRYEIERGRFLAAAGRLAPASAAGA